MRLLETLRQLQSLHGYLRDQDLRAAAQQHGVPLYRVQGLVSFYPHFRLTPPPRYEIGLCRDLSCHLAGGLAMCERARKRWSEEPGVEFHEVSCLGRCDRAPAAAVNGVASTAQAIAEADDLTKLASTTQADGPPNGVWHCLPKADPHEPFTVFRELLAPDRESAAERVLAELKAAGLRGMGGAGFPTATKWELVRRETRTPKYVICNADESEPGTFKDREILNRWPHLVIEGMLLAGLVASASHGILYIRHEYEPERQAFERALADAAAAGLLGSNVLGSDFDFEIEVFVSPGGYILGEETALLEALEDKRGEPRNKPPFPGTCGLHGQPTLINNVETLAMAPRIVRRGAAWWQAQARPGFAGLKFMAVSGHVERPGVYEIAVGTTVRELIEQAGGVKDGKPLKAFAPGGASSNFLPAPLADVPLDFGSIAKAGSMLGSGALVVVAEGTDMAELAANVVRFFSRESCGKCVPCRVGSRKAVELLDDYLADRKAPLDAALLFALGETLNLTSICGLGQVALNPVLSAWQYWPEEFVGLLPQAALNGFQP